jgi:hypothetical protein
MVVEDTAFAGPRKALSWERLSLAQEYVSVSLLYTIWALLTLGPLMASDLQSAGQKELTATTNANAHFTSLTISVTAGSDISFTGCNWASELSNRASALSDSEKLSHSGVSVGKGKGVGTCVWVFTLKMNAVWFSETSVHTYQNTRYHKTSLSPWKPEILIIFFRTPAGYVSCSEPDESHPKPTPYFRKRHFNITLKSSCIFPNLSFYLQAIPLQFHVNFASLSYIPHTRPSHCA